MHRYLVELSFPGAGQLRGDELAAIARRAQRITSDLGPGIQWEETYVSDHHVVVVYLADQEALVRRHVECLGLIPGPLARVTAVIGPASSGTII